MEAAFPASGSDVVRRRLHDKATAAGIHKSDSPDPNDRPPKPETPGCRNTAYAFVRTIVAT